MADALKPKDEAEVVEALNDALSGGKPLELVGHGSKRGIGRAAQTDRTLDVSVISGVTLYEPEELVLSARAGTPLAEIEKLLADKNQELAFEPPDLGPLLGGAANAATLGGTLAVNLSGPRRIKAGAARDFALGVRAVSGRGEIFKAGGRVVKNVTGYDLPKLLAGSWGTLAVMTELTIKVLPRAEDVATVLVLGLTDARAAEAMTAGMGSSNEVSGAAHLPPKVAAKIPVAAVAKAGRAVTALRLEGIAPSIAYRRQKLEDILKPIGTLGALDAEDSRAFWRAVRDVMPFVARKERAVWRISATATAGAAIGTKLVTETGAEVLYDWAGGLLWIEMPDGAPREAVVRGVLGAQGHATLMRADASQRAGDVFEPLEPSLAALAKRVKESFDPKGLLNPGRMYAGI
ncbi:MAG TPA: glycolate oxidase subunit GlcE [Xanthobacteraceae bacterium]|jgi:glycolate oxidase FAD binding subunit